MSILDTNQNLRMFWVKSLENKTLLKTLSQDAACMDSFVVNWRSFDLMLQLMWWSYTNSQFYRLFGLQFAQRNPHFANPNAYYDELYHELEMALKIFPMDYPKYPT